MAITYVGGKTVSGNSANITIDLTDLTGGIASSPSQYDVVVVVWGNVRNSNLDMVFVSSGYTEIADLYSDDTNDSNMGGGWKIMSDSPDTSVVVNGSGSANYGSACVVGVWRGVDTTTPLDVTSTTATGTAGNEINNPSITPTTSGAVIVIGGNTGSSSVRTVTTTPTGYGNMQEVTVDPTYATTCVMASKSWTSGAEDPSAWAFNSSGTNNAWCAITMALRPAATSGVSVVVPTLLTLNVG